MKFFMHYPHFNVLTTDILYTVSNIYMKNNFSPLRNVFKENHFITKNFANKFTHMYVLHAKYVINKNAAK